jgi:hypothetical protein
VGPSRQSAAIVIRQMQATIPKLSTQASIFFDKVRDGLSLPPSQPANEHAQHYLQRDGVDHGTELIYHGDAQKTSAKRWDTTGAEPRPSLVQLAILGVFAGF